MAARAQEQVASLADLSLEELSGIRITSVARRPEPLKDAAASVYVITGDDIRRAGVRSLPEALRLAPNLQVARIDASQYAITARGFNNSIGNKLLVLVDGRTVYTPVFSGVFWDQQDVMLEDVDRIEVISGPGATLWGANAVNGVINVITKSSAETQGVLASGGLGNRDRRGAVRYGGRDGQSATYRVYARTSDLRENQTTAGAPALDSRKMLQSGFRLDTAGGANRFTLQGDAYETDGQGRGSFGPTDFGAIDASGANVLARYNHRFGEASELQVQGYVDHMSRRDSILLHPHVDIVDLEAQHAFTLAAHRLVYGAGYRRSDDTEEPTLVSKFLPPSDSLEWGNVFAQDEISLSHGLTVTAGAKVEHNNYTGAEFLPHLRLGWRASPAHFFWSSVSRAVRSPARFDRAVASPLFASVGGPNFVSEVANVYELGYRASARRVSFSATAFLHDWDRLRSGTTLPLELQNKISGRVTGTEMWGTFQATGRWRLVAGLTTLHESLALEPGSTDPVGTENVTLRNDPPRQYMLRSSLELADNQELETLVRHVSALPKPAVPAYTALDLRYAWRPSRAVELSVTGQNLLDPAHAEFATSAAAPVEIERSIFFAVRYSGL